MKTIYIVTHGDKFSDPNPGMTPEGFAQVRALRPLLPEVPSMVVCGTGKRHLDVASALNMAPNRYTSAVGGPDSLKTVDGRKVILLADGTAVPPERYTTLTDEASAARNVVISLPDNAVICAGRPSIIMLGRSDARSAAVYRIAYEGDKIALINEVVAAARRMSDA